MKNSRWYLGRQYLGRRCRLCATNRGKTERILSAPNLQHGTRSDLRFPSTISSSCVLCTVYIYIYIYWETKNGTSFSSRLYCSDICRQCMIDCLFRSVLRHHLNGCAKGTDISHSCCHSGIAIFGVDGY